MSVYRALYLFTLRHRGEDAPQHRTNKPSSAAAPSWARGNPYAKSFPRARVWTRKQAPGLSGSQSPSGWDVDAEIREAKRTATRKETSAKDLYQQLVTATNLERWSAIVPENSTSPANISTKGLHKIMWHCKMTLRGSIIEAFPPSR